MNAPTALTTATACIRLTEGRQWIDFQTITQLGYSECERLASDIEKRCGPNWTRDNPRHRIAAIALVGIDAPQAPTCDLIDAAPALLIALEKLLFNVIHGNGSEAWGKSKDAARAAIAKAKGAPQS